MQQRREEEEGGGGGGARGAGRGGGGGGAGGHLLFSFHRSGVLLESSNAQTVRLGCPTSGPKPLKREKCDSLSSIRPHRR